MARGNGILKISVTVEEVDSNGNVSIKKEFMNKDHQIPTDSNAMSAVDDLCVGIGQTVRDWGKSFKPQTDK